MNDMQLDASTLYFTLGVIVGIALCFTLYFAYLEMLEGRDESD